MIYTDSQLKEKIVRMIELNKKKKNLKEPGNVDEQSIMLLLENFFIEE